MMDGVNPEFLIGDPSIVWILTGTEPATDAERLLNNAISIFADKEKMSQLIVDFECVAELYKKELVPTETWLRKRIDSFGLSSVVDAKNLASLIDNFLIGNQGLPSEVELIASKVDFDDLILDGILDQSLKELSIRSIVKSAASSSLADFDFTYLVPSLCVDACQCEVVVCVDVIVPENEHIIDGGTYTWDVDFSATIQFFKTEDDAVKTWMDAREVDRLVDAINSAWVQMGFKTEDLPSFSIGTKFLASLRAHGGQGPQIAGVLLKKIVRCLADPAIFADFRVDAKATSAVRVRSDGATGKRAHVTKKHAGYRLMAWRTSDGSIELANFGPKHEEVIEE